MKDWFRERYEINAHIRTYKDPKRYPGKIWYFLEFSIRNTRKLLTIFENITIPASMAYKLGAQSHSTGSSDAVTAPTMAS